MIAEPAVCHLRLSRRRRSNCNVVGVGPTVMMHPTMSNAFMSGCTTGNGEGAPVHLTRLGCCDSGIGSGIYRR